MVKDPLNQLIESLSDCRSLLADQLPVGNVELQDDFSAFCKALDFFIQLKQHNTSTQHSSNSNRQFKHDMRNAIGLVNGYIELILEQANDSAWTTTLSNTHQHCQNYLRKMLNRSDQSTPSEPSLHCENSAKAGQTDRPKKNSGTILVVDDDPNNCELLERYLHKDGHQIICAYSGEQALALLNDTSKEDKHQRSIDLILLDLIMPELDGLAVLKQLKKNPATRAIPVVIISGQHDTEGVVGCISAGADDYLFKPFDPTLLRARLNAGLERKRWHDKERQYRHELEINQRFIRQIFGRYLSDEIVASLLENPQGLELGGSRRTVTVLMSDIRGFTPLCETLPPEKTVALLNTYLRKLSEIILQYGGTIDEIQGDAILAIFGAPLSHSDDCDRAVACAIDMQNIIPMINQENAQCGLPAIQMGIAVNTGEVIVGNIGSEKRSKYAIVGHPVNLTARIETLAGAGEILISQASKKALLSEVTVVRQFSSQPKGISESVTIYQIAAMKGRYTCQLFEEDTESQP